MISTSSKLQSFCTFCQLDNFLRGHCLNDMTDNRGGEAAVHVGKFKWSKRAEGEILLGKRLLLSFENQIM